MAGGCNDRPGNGQHESGIPVMSLHGRADGAVAHDTLVTRIKSVLQERFGVEHITLQIEYGEVCVDHHDHEEERGGDGIDGGPAKE